MATDHGVIATRPLSVGVISPHEVMTRGLLSLLAASSPAVSARAVSWELAAGVDVLLYDVFGLVHSEAAEASDAQSLRRLGQLASPVVVAVDRPLRPDLTAEALRLGAAEYVAPDVSPQELVGMLHLALAANRGPGGAPTRAGVSRGSSEDRLGADVGLTPAEVATLRLIAAGLSNGEIAGELFVSVNTVKTRIRSAYRRLGITHRSQAVAWAIRHGLGAELS